MGIEEYIAANDEMKSRMKARMLRMETEISEFPQAVRFTCLQCGRTEWGHEAHYPVCDRNPVKTIKGEKGRKKDGD